MSEKLEQLGKEYKEVLLKQYNYGISPKRELEEKLTSMKIDFEKRYTK